MKIFSLLIVLVSSENSSFWFSFSSSYFKVWISFSAYLILEVVSERRFDISSFSSYDFLSNTSIFFCAKSIYSLFFSQRMIYSAKSSFFLLMSLTTYYISPLSFYRLLNLIKYSCASRSTFSYLYSIASLSFWRKYSFSLSLFDNKDISCFCCSISAQNKLTKFLFSMN
jgi:hypothetical protein